MTVIEALSILPKDDPEAVAVVRERLTAEGIRIIEHVKVDRVAREGNVIAAMVGSGGKAQWIEGTHLLVAAGRRPNVAGLGLEAAGIAYTPAGIMVDRRLRTSNKHVFAIGDVAGGFQFTHMAGYHAGIVIRNALFNLPAKVDYRAVPWVTYTDPELAHVGLSEAAAKAKDPAAKSVTWPFAENDRAQAERRRKASSRSSSARAASLSGNHRRPACGELILPWVLAVQKRLKSATWPPSSRPTRRSARCPSASPAPGTPPSFSPTAHARS